MPARFLVRLTDEAERDLEAIVAYLAENGSPAIADKWLDVLLERVDALETFPRRGTHLEEASQLEGSEFRQILLSPYRLIYRIEGEGVDVVLIADGRRDMRSLLAQRLLSR